MDVSVLVEVVAGLGVHTPARRLVSTRTPPSPDVQNVGISVGSMFGGGGGLILMTERILSYIGAK